MSNSEDPRSPFVTNSGPHPWRRYVAIGDSFTEGVGDPEPTAPNGFRGSAGGNDVIRPGTDPDDVSQQFEDAVVRLSRDGATLVVFTGIDTNFTPVFRG